MELNAIFSVCKVKNMPSGFVLGSDGDLVVKNTTDMANFKSVTTGHTLIMGRKTFESLGSKALPDRKMIVISSMDAADFKRQKDCLLARDLKTALTIAEDDLKSERAFIIGGAELLRSAMTKCNHIFYTIFNYEKEYDADKDVLVSMHLITGTNFFAMYQMKDLREQCTIVETGETKMLKFKMVSIKPRSVFNEDIRGRSDAKKIGKIMKNAETAAVM